MSFRDSREDSSSPESFLAALAAAGMGIAAALWKFKQLQENTIEEKENEGAQSPSSKESTIDQKITTPHLDNLSSRDITDLAHQGKIDPIIGREEEIRQMITLLSGDEFENPLLVGKAGVGKSAIVEGLAQWIAEKEEASALRGYRIVEIPVNSLVSGTQFRGDFEQRLKGLLEELIELEDNVIAFFDEFHLLIGSGSAGHRGLDASNILKPALGRGAFRCIGATTIEEYRRYVERESAFERRFHRIDIKEPDADETLYILQSLAPTYEEKYGITIQNSSLEAAIRLSMKYLPDQYLPAKAIRLVQEGAKRLDDRGSPPPEILRIQQKIKRLQAKQDRLTSDITGTSSEEQSGLAEGIEELRARYEALKRKWSRVKEKLVKIDQLYAEKVEVVNSIRNAELGFDAELMTKLRHEERDLEEQIQEIAKDLDPSTTGFSWAKPWLDGEDVALLIEEQTGVPLTQITDEDAGWLLQLESKLKQQVIGQDEAIIAVSDVIRSGYVRLGDPQTPIGSFLFLGPTGVGKTQLAKALADVLFGNEEHLVQLDMSEFQSQHTVFKLIGSPPGYVGYERAGQLTEKIRRQPRSIVLFDEIEKAHPRVLDILLQILEEGHLEDGKGRKVNFKETIVILTSNLEVALANERMRVFREEIARWEDIEHAHSRMDKQQKEIRKQLSQYLRSELLNRIDECILFSSLGQHHIEEIVHLQIEELQNRLDSRDIGLRLTPDAVTLLAREGYDSTDGARYLKRQIKRLIETPLTKMILRQEVKDGDIVTVNAIDDRLMFNVRLL